jgi:hypothetical protein
VPQPGFFDLYKKSQYVFEPLHFDALTSQEKETICSDIVKEVFVEPSTRYPIRDDCFYKVLARILYLDGDVVKKDKTTALTRRNPDTGWRHKCLLTNLVPAEASSSHKYKALIAGSKGATLIVVSRADFDAVFNSHPELLAKLQENAVKKAAQKVDRAAAQAAEDRMKAEVDDYQARQRELGNNRSGGDGGDGKAAICSSVSAVGDAAQTASDLQFEAKLFNVI